MTIQLDAIPDCFEGVTPSIIATCDADGVPNVTFLSVVHRLGEDRIGLSFQFFNKTRRNIAANPRAEILLYNPTTGGCYRLRVRFDHSETTGPQFDRMAAKISGAAANAGVPERFKLAGVDVYRVEDCEAVAGHVSEPNREGIDGIYRKVGEISRNIAGCEHMEEMIDATLGGLARQFAFDYSMVLIPEPDGRVLHTLASHGYSQSGVGSEVRLGEGVIGQAAVRRQPIRIGQWTRERLMGDAIGQRLREAGEDHAFAQRIPLPGLEEVESMLALPMVANNRLVGVLYLESARQLAFLDGHQEALGMLAGQLAANMLASEDPPEPPIPTNPAIGNDPAPSGRRRAVKRYEADNSVFIEHDYLIKGVAGAVLWVLLEDFVGHGRTEFSNRELRADPRLVLPDVVDNLETRLILLRRRLKDRDVGIHLEKTGRGRFRLVVDGDLTLKSIARP